MKTVKVAALAAVVASLFTFGCEPVRDEGAESEQQSHEEHASGVGGAGDEGGPESEALIEYELGTEPAPLNEHGPIWNVHAVEHEGGPHQHTN